MMHTHPTQQGFTLIEVLVALTLMALVSLIAWRGLDAVHHTGVRLDAHAEHTLSLLGVLNQIERDILLNAGKDNLPAQVTTPANNAQTTTRLPPGMVWDSTTGLGLVREAGNGNWQQLRWHLQDGTLYRTTGTPSHRLPLPPAETRVAVLQHVRALTLRVWQPGQGWVNPAQTVATNPRARSDMSAPAGIEVALYRQGPDADKPYRKVVLLP